MTDKNLGLKTGLLRPFVDHLFVFLILQLFLVQSGWTLRHGDLVITVVNTPKVNVRSAPRIGSDTFVLKVPRGEQLKQIGERGKGSNKWYQVVLEDGRKVWIHSKYAKSEIARDLLEVKVTHARVRQRPTTAKDSKVIGFVKQGDMLTLIREQSRWYRAVLENGLQGWIHKNLVVRMPIGPPDPDGKKVLSLTVPKHKDEEAKIPTKEESDSPIDFFQQGLEFSAENRIDEAIGAFQKAVESSPEDGVVHFELALLLKEKGKKKESIAHFKKALKVRPEAKFHIDAMINVRLDSTMSGTQGITGEGMKEGEAVSTWIDVFQKSATYLIPGVAVGSVVFLLVLGLLLYRKRNKSIIERPSYLRRTQDTGFDSVLKYAVEKRPLLRAIEEAERKRVEMDDALRQRFKNFDKQTQEGGSLPVGESSETLLKRIDDLRKSIMNQEDRAKIYADLVVLQNEKLEALDEEIEALKNLIKLEYQDVKQGTAQESDSEESPN